MHPIPTPIPMAKDYISRPSPLYRCWDCWNQSIHHRLVPPSNLRCNDWVHRWKARFNSYAVGILCYWKNVAVLQKTPDRARWQFSAQTIILRLWGLLGCFSVGCAGWTLLLSRFSLLDSSLKQALEFDLCSGWPYCSKSSPLSELVSCAFGPRSWTSC